jgi:hypothetical protein
METAGAGETKPIENVNMIEDSRKKVSQNSLQF